ncbi:MAG TPA: hypothetical protein VF762_19410 [Blastocatellia bacterium]|jgi:hypothetical protein
MPTSFPITQASYGSASTTAVQDEILEVYADLSYRRYAKSTAIHEKRTLHYDELSQAEYDSVKAFFKARKQAGSSDYAFNIIDPDDGSTHLCIFLDSEISFTRDGPCAYSGDINVLFLS